MFRKGPLRFGGWALCFWLAIPVLCLAEIPPENLSGSVVPSPLTSGSTPEIGNAIPATQEEIRDPFEVLFSQSASQEISGNLPNAPEVKIELQGIGFGSKDAYAVINGNIFRVGEEKDGIKLLEVRRHEVDILVDGVATALALFPKQDLKKAKERGEKKRAAANLSTVPQAAGASSFPKKETGLP